MESTDSSLSLAWCRELAEAYNGSTASAMIGITWQNNGNRFMTDIQSMQFVINALTPNTEYLLLFDVQSYMEENAEPSVRRFATRYIRTKYFSMLTKVIFFATCISNNIRLHFFRSRRLLHICGDHCYVIDD